MIFRRLGKDLFEKDKTGGRSGWVLTQNNMPCSALRISICAGSTAARKSAPAARDAYASPAAIMARSPPPDGGMGRPPPENYRDKLVAFYE